MFLKVEVTTASALGGGGGVGWCSCLGGTLGSSCLAHKPHFLKIFIYIYFCLYICWRCSLVSSITSLSLWYIHLAAAARTPPVIPTSHGKPGRPSARGWVAGMPVGALWCCPGLAVWGQLLPSILYFHGQCFMKSIRVYSVISMKEIIIIIYIIFALHVVFYFLYKKFNSVYLETYYLHSFFFFSLLSFTRANWQYCNIIICTNFSCSVWHVSVL